jgi:probable rRNA maturation factor
MPTTSKRRKNKVSVQYAVPRRGVPGASSIDKWCRSVSQDLNVTLRIVGAGEGRRLNCRFRNKDYATNVLAFAYGKGQGDVVLCHPVIAREARAQRKSVAAHYAHLVVHGLLHLRGYRHETKAEARRMARAETRLLARLGLPNPYAVE